MKLHAYVNPATPAGNADLKTLCGLRVADVRPHCFAGADFGGELDRSADVCATCKDRLPGKVARFVRNAVAVLVLAALAVGCQAAGGFARGAYSPEYEPLRVELGDHLARVVDVARNDVARIRDLVRDANANEPNAGTGALVQRVLLLVALEVATGGQLDVAPAPEGALAALPPGGATVPRERRRKKRGRRRRRLPPRTKTGRFRKKRRRK